MLTRYLTRQRKMLLAYLSNHIDEQLSAKQIALNFAQRDVSLSAVYRNLSALEKEGKVKRYSKSGTREVFYQYIAAEECCKCLHLFCKRCGKTFHMDADNADILISQVAKNEKFMIDKSETVLYGICENCNR